MIKLYNRDGLNIWLEPIGKDLYTLKSDEKSKWGLEYLRVGLSDDKNKYDFIDPPGGPFLTKGYKLKDDNHDEYIIKDLSRIPFVITLEKQ